MTTDREIRSSVPSIDRAWELLERAYADRGIKVLGWADNMVLAPRGTPALEFTVSTAAPASHEDHVLIVALTVPHPDEMSFQEVVEGASS